MPRSTVTRAATPWATSHARSGSALPTLRSLGLGHVANLGPRQGVPRGAVGRLAERSPGKDSVTGHWELMGLVIDRPFPVFPDGFPPGDHRGIRASRRPPQPRQQGGLGHRDHRGTGRGTPAHRRAHRLHLGRQRVPDCRARGDDSGSRALPDVRGRVRPRLARARRRARHRAAFRRCPGSVPAARRIATTTRSSRSAPTAARPPRQRRLAGHLGRQGQGPVCGPRHLPREPDDERRARPRRSSSANCSESPRGLIFANLVDSDAKFGHRNDPAGYAANLEADRRTPARSPRAPRAGRRAHHHGRSRQRSHDAEHRPLAGIRAPPRRRPGHRGRHRPRHAGRRSRTSARRWRRSSASLRPRQGRASPRSCGHGADGGRDHADHSRGTRGSRASGPGPAGRQERRVARPTPP